MKNVVLLTIDALRKDMAGCYGKKDSRTPFLDSIRNNCIRFDKAQSTGPYTQASFPGILTSSYFLEYGKPKKLPAQKSIVSEVLKNSGVTTAAFHSNAYLSYYFGYKRGWDEFYDSMEIDDIPDMYPFVRGNIINDKVKKWLNGHLKEPDYKPFFLWTHYMDVHEPYIPEKEYLSIVDQSINMSPDEMYALFKDILLKRDISSKENVELLKKLYEAKVLEVDGYIRTFFENLMECGVLEDTVVIITSDHGDEFGEHGGLSHDGKMYSELIDVPLLIYDSQIKTEVVYENLVSSVDIAPTITGLLGVNPSESYRGKSLLPLREYSSDGCYSEAMDKAGHKEKDTDRPVYFFREGDVKIIYREKDNAWEMYELQSDLEEKNDIIGVSPKAEEMKSKLISVIKKNKKI